MKKRGFNGRRIKIRESNVGDSDLSAPYICMLKISAIVYMYESAKNTDKNGLVNYKLKVTTIDRSVKGFGGLGVCLPRRAITCAHIIRTVSSRRQRQKTHKGYISSASDLHA